MQIPDLVVDAVTLLRFDSLGIVPAGDNARVVAAADVARERIADDHRLALLDRPNGGENLVEKLLFRFLRAKLLGEEHAVHQRAEAGARQLLRLRDDRAVRDDALAHLAAQRLDDLIAVVAVDDGVAQTQLVGIVKLRREGNVDALLREKLLKAADEHLRLRDLAALEFFPVFHIQDGIARDLFFRAFAKAELNKKALDGGALGGIKV